MSQVQFKEKFLGNYTRNNPDLTSIFKIRIKNGVAQQYLICFYLEKNDYSWEAYNDNKNSCQFSNGDYHFNNTTTLFSVGSI